MKNLLCLARRSQRLLYRHQLTRYYSSSSAINSASVSTDPATPSPPPPHLIRYDQAAEIVKSNLKNLEHPDPMFLNPILASQKHIFSALDSRVTTFDKGLRVSTKSIQVTRSSSIASSTPQPKLFPRFSQKNIYAAPASVQLVATRGFCSLPTGTDKSLPTTDPVDATKNSPVDETTNPVDATKKTLDEKTDPVDSTKKKTDPVDSTKKKTDPGDPHLFDVETLKKVIMATHLEMFFLFIGRYPLIGDCFVPLANFLHRAMKKIAYIFTFGRIGSSHTPFHTKEEAAMALANALAPWILFLIACVLGSLMTWVKQWVKGSVDPPNDVPPKNVPDQSTKKVQIVDELKRLAELTDDMRSRTDAVEREVEHINRALSSPFELIKRILGF